MIVAIALFTGNLNEAIYMQMHVSLFRLSYCLVCVCLILL